MAKQRLPGQLVIFYYGPYNNIGFTIYLPNLPHSQIPRDSIQLLISIRTVTPPQVLPSCLSLGDDVSCDVSAVVTTRCDVKRLDHALRKIFEDKYEVGMRDCS